MANQDNKTPNSLIPDLALFENLSRGFLVNKLKTLRPIEAY